VTDDRRAVLEAASQSLHALGVAQKLRRQNLRRRMNHHEHELVVALEAKLHLNGICQRQISVAMLVALTQIAEVDRGLVTFGVVPDAHR
jgi:hypothetical protein